MSDHEITVVLERHLAHALIRAAERGAAQYRRAGEDKAYGASSRAMALATADEVDKAISIIEKAID